MFRVALVLFKNILGRPDQLAECPGLYETMEKIRNIPAEYMQEDFLIREVSAESVYAFLFSTYSYN